MKNNYKATITMSSIFIIIQSLTMVGYIVRHQYNLMSGLVAITILFVIYTYFKFKFRVYMNLYVTILVLLTLLGHNLIGEYIGLYFRSTVYDKFLHSFGTYTFALFLYTIINDFFPDTYYIKWREFIYIIAIGATTGMFFELIEFAADVILKPVIPNQADLLDTNLDMIFNTLGAVVAAIHGYVKDYGFLRAKT